MPLIHAGVAQQNFALKTKLFCVFMPVYLMLSLLHNNILLVHNYSTNFTVSGKVTIQDISRVIMSPAELKTQPTIHWEGKAGYLPRRYPALRSI
jgi:hypothetical protein